MKRPLKNLIIIVLGLVLNLSAFGQDENTILSPYFLVKSDHPSFDQLPLKSTSAKVDIAGVIADVKVKQVYKNEGEHTLEAIYVFPGSTSSAVYGMTMTIGNRTIKANIEEKQKAKQQYEKAKSEGKRASLLEQHRPNVFQMNVANIAPGDEITVELSYTEMLKPTEGIYEFAYPTVVGPRYSGNTTQAQPVSNTNKTNTTNIPYQKEGENASYDLDIQVFLSAGMPIQNINCTSHKIKVNHESLSDVSILLNKTEKKGGNRDFILNYQLSGERIASGLLLYEHDDEKFFMLNVQPPERVTTKEIAPREYIFIVDVSGSMNGFPLDITKKLMRDLILGLRQTDRFNVLLFAGTSGWLAEESLNTTEQNLAKAVKFIDAQRGGGGTELLPALRKALSFPRCVDGLSRSFVVVTDGYINVEAQTFDLIRENLNQANLFAFGIGSGVNRHLIEGMARIGQAEPMVITEESEAAAKAEKFRQYINAPVLTEVTSSFNGFEVYDVEPPSIPDVMAERPITLFGKWKGEAKGNITIAGYASGKPYSKTFQVAEAKNSVKHTALRYLWARERIKTLDDYNSLRQNDERKLAVTKLGLKYSLMTAYTSFIAIDNIPISDEDRESLTVKQALPLPSGVSNSAVGFDLSVNKVVRKSKRSKEAKTGIKHNAPTFISTLLEKNLQAKIKALKKQFLGNTKVNIHFKINALGQVTDFKILSSEMSELQKNTIKRIIKTWQFVNLGLTKETSVDFSMRL